MIVLDYTYFFAANFYQWNKNTKDVWRIFAVLLSALFLGFFILFFLMVGESKHSIELSPPFGVAVGLVCVLLLGVRYTWFTSYEKIEKRLKGLSKTKTWILNICTAIYLLIAIPGSITAIALGAGYFK